jgi:hypothetical protein
MSPLEDALTRVVARQLGRALPVRQTSSLALDPMNTIGVVTIKIVTEEQIQAIAYGRLGEEPNVIVRLDPIGRDVTDLLPFARFMARVAETALEHGQLRVWVPHSGALEALDILGHRYWRNQSAPPEIVRMGEVCRIIAHEATFPGQQLVANAADMLRSHLITGLCPLEEGHLDALLAWLDPAVINPLLEARERIRVPASGILPNTPDQPLDDRVDRLRRIWKSSRGSRRSVAETEIRRILRAAVLREWQILAQARDAFLRLALPATGLGALVKASQARIQYSLESGYFPARSADRLAVQFDEMEAGQQLIDLAALENDPSVRERARHAGEVIGGVVTRVLQPKPSFKPCSLDRLASGACPLPPRRQDQVGGHQCYRSDPPH